MADSDLIEGTNLSGFSMLASQNPKGFLLETKYEFALIRVLTNVNSHQ